MENNSALVPYAHVIIKLLQGPIYADESSWRDLRAWESPIHEYFGKIGLELVINETDGFGRIVQQEAEDNEDNPLPRLMRKQTMNYETTLLCVILREMLEELDILSEATKLFVTQKEIKERIELFYKEVANRSRLWRDLAKPINNLQGMGILKLIREDSANKDKNQFEVKRIIKALISNEKLEEVRNKLKEYVDTIQQ
jgi:Domain of unknown function (DUF4194)